MSDQDVGGIVSYMKRTILITLLAALAVAPLAAAAVPTVEDRVAALEADVVQLRADNAALLARLERLESSTSALAFGVLHENTVVRSRLLALETGLTNLNRAFGRIARLLEHVNRVMVRHVTGRKT